MKSAHEQQKIETPKDLETPEALAREERRFLRHASKSKLARLFVLLTTLWGGSAEAAERTGQESRVRAPVSMLEGSDPSDRRMEGKVSRWLAREKFITRIKTEQELQQAIEKKRGDPA